MNDAARPDKTRLNERELHLVNALDRLQACIEALRSGDLAAAHRHESEGRALRDMADTYDPGLKLKPGDIVIILGRKKAETLSEGMADLLCWCRGYHAGRPEHDAFSPMGVDETRQVRNLFLDAFGAHARMPF